MSAARSLRRLLRVLALEEEQAHAALESSLAQLRIAQNAMAAVLERERAGRRLVVMSAHSGEAIDRLAALEQMATARRLTTVLHSQRTQAERVVVQKREKFLAKRVERRQVETLISEAEARDSAERSRRAQQMLDDWYLGRFIQSDRLDDEIACASEEHKRS